MHYHQVNTLCNPHPSQEREYLQSPEGCVCLSLLLKDALILTLDRELFLSVLECS